jgi:hypothetical protein
MQEPVLLVAFMIILHSKLCLSVIIFFICLCWHPERTCRALSSFRKGKLDLLSALTIPHAFGCTGSLFCTSNDALGFNRDIGCC